MRMQTGVEPYRSPPDSCSGILTRSLGIPLPSHPRVAVTIYDFMDT